MRTLIEQDGSFHVRFEGVADEGSVIVLTATPPAGYYLDRWGGDVVRTGLNTAVLVLNGASEVRAYYLPYPVDLTVDVEHPEWGSVQVEPVKEEYFPGDVVQITPIQKDGSSFVGFEAEPGVDGYVALQQLPLVIRLTGDTHIIARFGHDVAVQAFVDGEGSVEITPEPQQAGRLECSAGTEVTLTAVPAEDWVFIRWEGDVSSSDVSLQLSASEDVIVQAVFEEEATVRYANLTFAPSEHVTVRPETPSRTYNPWWNGQHTVTDRFLSGSIISVSASKSGVSANDSPSGEPTTDYFWRGYMNGYEGPSYMGWLGWWESGAKVLVPRWQTSGGGGTMWMGHFRGEPGEPVATSSFPVCSVTVGIEGRGMVVGGRPGGPFVFPEGNGVNFARTHPAEFVQCMPMPLDGWQFLRWEHSSPNILTGTDVARVWFKGQSAQSESLTAVFVPALPVELDIEKVGEGQVSPEAGHHTLGEGDLVILEATPADGWVFDRWECDGCAFVSRRLRAGLIIEEDMSIRAVFKKNALLLTHVIGEGYVLRTPQGVFYPQVGSPPEDAVVRLEAVANADADFVQWEGTGVAYATSALTNPLPLDNPSQPLNLPAIWVVMGPELPGGTRSITARFRCSCGCGAYVDQDDGERCETLCGEACVEVDLCPDNPDKMAPGACGCDEPDTDSDGDWVPDCDDGCPDEPGKSEEGDCGCYQFDIDNDGDGTPNCNDQCPFDPFKTEKGDCDCYTPDVDTDNDGTMDCDDACPANPLLIEEGPCGCDTTDTDSDGTLDCQDACPNNPDLTELGVCGCSTSDIDGDATLDCQDGCPENPFLTQPGAFGCARHVLIQADLVDLVPEGGSFASGIDATTLTFMVNGAPREPEISCTQDGMHVEFLLPIQELLSPGQNSLSISIKDSVENGSVYETTF